jgi:hypothetical protein
MYPTCGIGSGKPLVSVLSIAEYLKSGMKNGDPVGSMLLEPRLPRRNVGGAGNLKLLNEMKVRE